MFYITIQSLVLMAVCLSVGVLAADWGGDRESVIDAHEYGPGVCLGDGPTEAYLEDTGMAALASAWAMARVYLKDMGMTGLASA